MDSATPSRPVTAPLLSPKPQSSMTQSARVINICQSNFAAMAGTSCSCHDRSNDRNPVANSTISSSVSARHTTMDSPYLYRRIGRLALVKTGDPIIANPINLTVMAMH
ncbi:hypothetical protein AB0E01_41275 [Nocardia vinacea]|uniref:hypothetical protein n=1 Tax=Nocardia vinacea TaxID=96468 RepID=UPI0033CD8DE0